jgi:hypothetical protein
MLDARCLADDRGRMAPAIVVDGHHGEEATVDVTRGLGGGHLGRSGSASICALISSSDCFMRP